MAKRRTRVVTGVLLVLVAGIGLIVIRGLGQAQIDGQVQDMQEQARAIVLGADQADLLQLLGQFNAWAPGCDFTDQWPDPTYQLGEPEGVQVLFWRPAGRPFASKPEYTLAACFDGEDSLLYLAEYPCRRVPCAED